MRFLRGMKKGVALLTLVGFSLAVSGCGQSSTGSMSGSGTSGSGARVPAGPLDPNQAGSDQAAGAEVPNPAP